MYLHNSKRWKNRTELKKHQSPAKYESEKVNGQCKAQLNDLPGYTSLQCDTNKNNNKNTKRLKTIGNRVKTFSRNQNTSIQREEKHVVVAHQIKTTTANKKTTKPGFETQVALD